MRHSVTLVGLVLMVGCGGSYDPIVDTQSSGGAGATQGPGSVATGGAFSTGGTRSTGGTSSASCDLPVPATRDAYVPPSSCELPEQDLIGTASTSNQLLDLMVGQWLLCGFPSTFGTNDEIGLELTSDGSWYKLYPDGAGGLKRGVGWDVQGTYEMLDDGGYMQLNLNIAGSGTVITIPDFAGTPLKVRLNNEGVFVGDYIKNDASGRCVTAT